MRRYLAPIFVFASLVFVLGMGGTPALTGKIPMPDRNFKTLVTDREGIKTALSQFSYEGKVFLEGKRGDAIVSIPFEKIAEVEVGSSEQNEVTAQVLLHDQKKVQIKLIKLAKFFGQADFGTFQIEAKDVKTISFHP